MNTLQLSLKSFVVKSMADQRVVKGLSSDRIQGILERQVGKSTTERRSGYPPPEQYGPLRFYDGEFRCASRGCGSPTHYQFRGIPRCVVHVLRLMNEELMTDEERELANG
jgi:hypothetical protein